MTRKSAPYPGTLRPNTTVFHVVLSDRRLPSVDRALKDHPELIWSILVTHEPSHLRKATRNAVWSQHFREEPPTPCNKEKLVNVAESRLYHVFRRLPIQRTESIRHVQARINERDTLVATAGPCDDVFVGSHDKRTKAPAM